MKRGTYAWLLILSVLLVVVGGILWLIETNDGARFVLKNVVRYVPGRVEVGEIRGVLAGELSIKEIRIQSEAWDVSIQRLNLRWTASNMLAGWLRIRKIELDGVSIEDLKPDVRNPVDLTWPYVSGILSWLKIRVKSLSINEMVYKEAGQELWKINIVNVATTWYLGGLKVKILKAETPLGGVEGTIGASFTRPMLVAHLRIKTDKPHYDLDEYTVNLELQDTKSPFQLTGPVGLIGFNKNTERVKFAGSLGLEKTRIVLENFQFREMGRQGALDINGFIDPSIPDRPFEVVFSMKELGISKDPKLAPAVSGSIQVKGDHAGYAGTFDLRNTEKSWRQIALTGGLRGNWDSARLTALKGTILDGEITGMIDASWKGGFLLAGEVSARNLNPARITADWPGTINADLSGRLDWSHKEYPEGLVKASLLQSVVRKRPLTGKAEARWAQGLFSLADCELHGHGFDFSCHGVLQKQLNYQARVDDLGGVIPEAAGKLTATGWIRLNKGQWSGVTQIDGDMIGIGGMRLDAVSAGARVNDEGTDLISGRLQARNILYGDVNCGSLDLGVDGKTTSHQVKVSLSWPKSSATMWAKGEYKEGLWSGTMARVEGRDAYSGTISLVKPAVLKISTDTLSLSPLIITGGTSGEVFEIGGDIPFGAQKGNLKANWQKFNLARLNSLLNRVSIEGQTSGRFEALWTGKDQYKMSGAGSGALNVTTGPDILRITKIETKFNWDNKGLNGDWDVSLHGGARVGGYITSNEPARMRLPESAEFKGTWRDVNTDVLKRWLPKTIDLAGRLSGKIDGKLMSGQRINVSGESRLSEGSISWRTGEGLIKAEAEKVEMGFVWKESNLKGTMEMLFPSYGKVSGIFTIPLPARFPAKIEKSGATEIIAKGEIREKGIVSALFPGVIEESKGRLIFEAKRGGTWESPDTTGTVKLMNGSAYLQSAGIRVKDVALDAFFVQDRMEVTSFSARSGQGSIHGNCTFWFKDRGISRFKGRIGGERFLAVYQPELHVQIDPDITFEGAEKRTVIRGSILVPEALVRDSGNKEVVTTSKDVVLIDAHQKVKTPRKVDIDLEIAVVMGEKVRIQLEGLDSHVEGKVLLTSRDWDTIRGKGELRLVKGKFSSYGVKLDITRGNIVFNGGPVNRASLDVMALRTFNPGRFDETKTGVTVTGTPGDPLVKLYSDPSMAETDILSYMVLGRSLQEGEGSNQTAALLKAAAGIFGGKQASGLQDQIQQRLGIDTLEVQEETRSAFTSSRTVSTDNGTINRSFVTVGKYLHPKLYIGYGRSVFTDEYLLTARYSLLKNLDVETKTGLNSSVDLIYKVEFD